MYCCGQVICRYWKEEFFSYFFLKPPTVTPLALCSSQENIFEKKLFFLNRKIISWGGGKKIIITAEKYWADSRSQNICSWSRKKVVGNQGEFTAPTFRLYKFICFICIYGLWAYIGRYVTYIRSQMSPRHMRFICMLQRKSIDTTIVYALPIYIYHACTFIYLPFHCCYYFFFFTLLGSTISVW